MEAVEVRIELREVGFRRELQRIEIGGEMAYHAIGAHELNGADGLPRSRARVCG